MAKTFEELWTELKAEAAAEWQNVEADVKAEWQKVKPVVEADVVAVLSQFKKLAVQTVINLGKAEFASLTGAEKQGTVITTIFQAAEAAGKDLAISDARLLGQQAYDYVSAQVPGLNP